MNELAQSITEVEPYKYQGKLPVYKKSQAFLENEIKREPSVKNILDNKEQFKLSFYEWAKQSKFQEV